MFTPRLLKLKIHSRRVLIFKRCLPIFAFVLASIMIIWPHLSEQKDKFTTAQMPKNTIKGAQINMQQVRFFSTAQKKGPITVVADSVKETNPAKHIITLQKPIATYQMNNDTVLTSTAPYALAFQNEEYLFFEKQVNSKTNTGWTSFATQVKCDYKNGVLSTQAPVSVSGPDGDLNAEQGVTIYENGDKIDFHGLTKTVITSIHPKMEITSKNGKKINQILRTITAIGDVVTVRDNQTIYADKMIVFYNDASGSTKERIDRIEAFGNVVATNQTHKISGDKGVYNPQNGVIEMTGHVVLSHGSNTATGDTAILNLNNGKSSLTTEHGENAGRIKGQFVPAELE